MCIRDRRKGDGGDQHDGHLHCGNKDGVEKDLARIAQAEHCLLYTSDAADERSSVDLGGRRIIKKKKNQNRSDGKI